MDRLLGTLMTDLMLNGDFSLGQTIHLNALGG
jgi:hypothetical protein